MDKYKAELDQLEKEERELRDKLSDNRKRVREIEEQEFLEKVGVQYGTMIEFMDGRTRLTGKFSRFDGSWGWAFLTKRDGTVGERERRIYNTESIKPLLTIA